MVENQKSNKDKIDPNKYLTSKDDLLFMTLIIITFIAGFVISIKSRKYTLSLKKQNPNYYYPTLFEITIKTTIYTFILLIPKILIEKALFPFTEKILIEKYKKKEFMHEKEKAKRKMTIYVLKFIHYLILTIHSYFVFNKLEFFPKELFGDGEMNTVYDRGLDSFTFFERPKMFDFHYLLNLVILLQI